MNIPIYRAKKTDSDEFVDGYYQQFWDDDMNKRVHQIFWETRRDEDKPYAYDHHFVLIYPSTLAIHFPDMIDSEGNKIFASLSEDGKGGDNLRHLTWIGKDEPHNLMTAYFTNSGMVFKSNHDWQKNSIPMLFQVKVVGIQE